MARIVQLTLWSTMVLVSFALLPPMFPISASATGSIAQAQMLQDEVMAKNLGSKEERMKKSSIDGPGMKSLSASDPQWCRPCHLNHDKVRASRAGKARAKVRTTRKQQNPSESVIRAVPQKPSESVPAAPQKSSESVIRAAPREVPAAQAQRDAASADAPE
jgi:hypothetical protein